MTTRILLVEDDPITQDVIRALCETRGLAVDVAADGFLGLRLLSERRHPIALIDYHLPEMDGYALARLMRQVSGNAGSNPSGNRDDTLKLVGITADRDGLALRRGADALFDAILVKPLDPTRLFSILDRLMEPADPSAAALGRARAFLREPDAERARAAADAFWRRRGLDRRPRALPCPGPSPEQAAAIGLCFDIAVRAQDADLALLLDASGLEPLRALRGDPAGCLIPAVDLTGRSTACEAGFRIDEPDAWSAVARLLREGAERREQLAPAFRRPSEPAARLLALLFVAARPFVLNRAGDEGVSCSVETGLSSRTLVATLTDLNGRGLVACTLATDAITIALSDEGRRFLTGQAPAAQIPAGRAEPEETVLRTRVAALLEPSPLPGEDDLWSGLRRRLAQRRDVTSGDTTEDAAVRPIANPPETMVRGLGIEGEAPVLNRRKIDELGDLIGPENVASLRGRLVEQLLGAFREAGQEGGQDVAPSPEALGREAHVLLSIAGMLGCDRLSWACTRLERAAKAGDNLDDPLAAVRTIRDETLALLASPNSPDLGDQEYGSKPGP